MLILTPNEILRRGLICAGFKVDRRSSVTIQLRRFRAHYGSHPLVYAELLEDLQTAEDPSIHVEMIQLSDLDNFLLCLNFLRCYQTEHVLSGLFQKDERRYKNGFGFMPTSFKLWKRKRYMKSPCFVKIARFTLFSVSRPTASLDGRGRRPKDSCKVTLPKVLSIAHPLHIIEANPNSMCFPPTNSGVIYIKRKTDSNGRLSSTRKANQQAMTNDGDGERRCITF